MVSGLWGKKIGMTQLFSEKNAVVPVTVIDVGGWFVTNVRTVERDGYVAVQVGFVKDRYANDSFSVDWIKKPKKYFRSVREIRVAQEGDLPKVGTPFDFASIVESGTVVDVFGTTKGCGFAGVLRRHNFSGPPSSHGHTMGKRTGSIGCNATQGKVVKGKKMPGQMGNVKRVTRNLKVIKVEQDAKVVLVKGSVPGKSGSLVFIRKEIV